MWQQKFRKTLHAFPDSSPFCSLYSLDPAYDPRSYSGVTTQFLEQSDVYHAKFTDHRRWTYLLSQALFRLQLDESRDISVLDVGSGSGNSVYPMLTLLPTASIVATDISPQLLALLHKQLSVTDRQRVLAVAMDASQPFLARESFDLVVGAAILHHIMDPSTTLAACCDALKPTGHAIFFEPFETGYVLLRFLYEQLVNNSDRFRLPDTVRQVLQAIIVDITVRTGSDKTADLYKSLDDKWQFTRAYFERQRSQCGFSSLMIYPLDSPVGQFSAQLRTHLRLCLNAGPESVSDLVWEFVREFEGHFSPASAPERALEACVIFSR
ncbi:MAG: class I SAM-dependent methyltransferase [Acidobacteriaceae bacterium]|nr:class I SAM-dependent methyltransferase [Acidobacteriaceae bacterium]